MPQSGAVLRNRSANAAVTTEQQRQFDIETSPGSVVKAPSYYGRNGQLRAIPVDPPAANELSKYRHFPLLYKELLYRRKFKVQSLSFFDLPREIRDMIYEAALVKHSPVDPWPPKPCYSALTRKPRARRIGTAAEGLTVQLIRCNRRTYEEGSVAFYGRNLFQFSRVRACLAVFGVRAFRNRIGSRSAKLIKKLCFTAPLGAIANARLYNGALKNDLESSGLAPAGADDCKLRDYLERELTQSYDVAAVLQSFTNLAHVDLLLHINTVAAQTTGHGPENYLDLPLRFPHINFSFTIFAKITDTCPGWLSLRGCRDSMDKVANAPGFRWKVVAASDDRSQHYRSLPLDDKRYFDPETRHIDFALAIQDSIPEVEG